MLYLVHQIAGPKEMIFRKNTSYYFGSDSEGRLKLYQVERIASESENSDYATFLVPWKIGDKDNEVLTKSSPREEKRKNILYIGLFERMDCIEKVEIFRRSVIVTKSKDFTWEMLVPGILSPLVSLRNLDPSG